METHIAFYPHAPAKCLSALDSDPHTLVITRHPESYLKEISDYSMQQNLNPSHGDYSP